MQSHSTAAERALQTAEILELILSTSSARDLILAQRVSRFWCGVISGSRKLHQVLFLSPEWPHGPRAFSDIATINEPGPRPRNNILTRRVLQGRYPTLSLRTEPIDAVNRAAEPAMQTQGKAPECDGLGADTTTLPQRVVWTMAISFPSDVRMLMAESKKATRYRNATWRNMVLTQPPCTTLYLTRGCKRTPIPIITCDTGITIQQLINTMSLARDSGKWPEEYIGYDGDWHLEGDVPSMVWSG